jgi:hypothetical protein
MAGKSRQPTEIPAALRECDAWQIRDAMNVMGAIWAGEQIEGDDEGVTQVEGIVSALRAFAEHEAAEDESDDSMDLGCSCGPPCC